MLVGPGNGADMKRVIGIGGIFFKANDPTKLCAWYDKHLGIEMDADGSGATFACEGDPSCVRVVDLPAQLEVLRPERGGVHDQLPG